MLGISLSIIRLLENIREDKRRVGGGSFKKEKGTAWCFVLALILQYGADHYGASRKRKNGEFEPHYY